MNICLTKMTKDLCRTFMQEFVPDIDLFENPNAYKPYVYDQHGCDAYFERHQRLTWQSCLGANLSEKLY